MLAVIHHARGNNILALFVKYGIEALSLIYACKIHYTPFAQTGHRKMKDQNKGVSD